MPVVVPNSFYKDYDICDSRYNNSYSNNLETDGAKSLFALKLEQKVKRLENINNIFLNMLRENALYHKSMNRNLSSDYISSGSFPFLSFDKSRNKHLVYLNKDRINNNRILDGNYKDKYLVPIFPKYNSVIENNRMNLLLNKEKLKYCRNDVPYFIYNNSLNIPQKINSVQYFNKKIDYKKFNSNDQINNINFNKDNDSKEESKLLISKRNNPIINNDIRNEITKLSKNLNERLDRVENFQKSQKKDIDFLMGKSKGNNKSEKSEKKESKNEEKKESKKEEKQESKESEESEDDDGDDDDNDDEEEKEIDIKSINSD